MANTDRATAPHLDDSGDDIRIGDRVAFLQYVTNAPTVRGEGTVVRFDRYGGIVTTDGYVVTDWSPSREANIPNRSRSRAGEYLRLVLPQDEREARDVLDEAVLSDVLDYHSGSE